MRQKSVTREPSSERIVKNIRRATRNHHSPEEKIRIVLDGLRGESSIAALCRREGIAENLYYAWSKEFLEAGKRRLAATRRGQQPVARSKTCDARRKSSRRSWLNRRSSCAFLKKSMIADGGDEE